MTYQDVEVGPASDGEAACMLDPLSPHVQERLQRDLIIWLTTVRPDGQPQSSPVWFWWDGSTFLIYSKPDNQKVRSIARNPRVSLNLDGDKEGGDIVTIEGTARVARDEPPADQVSQYLEKYREGIKEIGMNPQSFARSYCEPIRVTPQRARVW
jgi:PPOX class probable F420-dependent enzyme